MWKNKTVELKKRVVQLEKKGEQYDEEIKELTIRNTSLGLYFKYSNVSENVVVFECKDGTYYKVPVIYQHPSMSHWIYKPAFSLEYILNEENLVLVEEVRINGHHAICAFMPINEMDKLEQNKR